MFKRFMKFIAGEWHCAKYRFSHWLFRWTVDDENGLTFTVAGFINFTKCKEHTIIRWGRRYREPAPKYVLEPKITAG